MQSFLGRCNTDGADGVVDVYGLGYDRVRHVSSPHVDLTHDGRHGDSVG